MSLMNMSIAGAVMILVVILIRALLIDKLPKRTFIILWMIVIARLLIPVEIASKTSVYNLRPELMTSPAEIMEVEEVPMAVETAEVNNIEPVAMEEPVKTLKINANHIWVIGVLLISAYFVRTYNKSKKILNTSISCDDERIINYVKSNSDRNIDIRWLDRINTAITYGIFKSIIVLPKRLEYADDETIEKILLHEHYHIESYDSIKKLLMMVTLIVHWFNPLVWIMYIIFNRDMELYCDERVLIHLGRDERADYAYTLIEQADRDNTFSLSSGFSKNALEERVRSVMKYKKSTVITIGLAVVVLIGVVVFFATSKEKEVLRETSRIEDIPFDAISTSGDSDGLTLSVSHGAIEKTPLYYFETTADKRVWIDYEFKHSKNTVITFENSKGEVEEIANSDVKKGDAILNLTEGINIIYIESANRVGKFSFNAKHGYLTYNHYYSPNAVRKFALLNFEKSEYEKFGLDLDENDMTLHYGGKRVKRFYDINPIMANENKSIEYKKIDFADDSGEVYLYALRSDVVREDGEVVELVAANSESEYEFAKKRIEDSSYWLKKDLETGVINKENASNKFLEYEPYGIKYDDDKNKLSYNGQNIKNFFDLRQIWLTSNEYDSEIISQLEFTGDEKGIHVYAIRDHSDVDEHGIGRLKNLIVAKDEADYREAKEKIESEIIKYYETYDNKINQGYSSKLGEILKQVDITIDSVKLTDRRDSRNLENPKYVVEAKYHYNQNDEVKTIRATPFIATEVRDEFMNSYSFSDDYKPEIVDGVVFETKYYSTDNIDGDLMLEFYLANPYEYIGQCRLSEPITIE